ncbi:MAG: hypothetical protein J0I08_07545, partial [Rhizobiales bacterium]|nr:hypothetical protein [Hyphomicrobiales bacterium]
SFGGSSVAENSFYVNGLNVTDFYNRNGSVVLLKIDGKKVTKTQDIEVGGLPEAVVFTPDGKYILVGNYLDQDFSILKVNGTKVKDTGKRFKVPGHPASARMSH